MTRSEVPFVVGAICYALSTAYGIRFTNNRTVPTAAALAPAVCLVGLGDDVFSPSVMVLCPIGALFVLLARRRPTAEIVRHVGLFGLVTGTLVGLGAAGLQDPLALAVVGGVVYLLGENIAQRIRVGKQLLVEGDRRTWLLLHGVLVCACGLTALGVQQMDWPAFIAMAFVLVLTKREFEAFALSRTAYAQTVRAIDRLKGLEAPRT